MPGPLRRLAAHEGFRRYFSNTSWLFSEQILRLVAGLLVGILVARYLGPARFGEFNYAVAFVALFAGIAKLGLDSIVVRDLVREPEKRDLWLGTAFRLKLAGALLAGALMAGAAALARHDARTNLYVFIIAAGLFFQASEVIDFYFQSRVLARFVSICRITQLILSSLLKLWFVFVRADLLWFVVVTLVDQASLAVALHLAYRAQKLGSFLRSWDRGVARALLVDSWPLVFSGVLAMIYLRIDQVMIKNLLGDRPLGIYSAAVRISEVGYFIPGLLTSSLFPAIVNAKRTSETLYYSRLQRTYTLMIWLAFATLVPTLLLSGWIVRFLYGESYAEAGGLLKILALAGFNVYLGAAWNAWMICENRQSLATIGHAVGALLNIGLNLLLIPRMGVAGSAVATLLSYWLAALFVYSLYKPGLAYGMFLRGLLLKGVLYGRA